MKQLLLDLRDVVKYWKRATRVAKHSLKDARLKNQRLQLQLEGAIKHNEHSVAMFLGARRDVAIVQAELQLVAQSRVELEVRLGKLKKERKFLFGALFVCVGLVAACWRPWIM